MNHREQPHLPVGTRRALHYLSLLLLPAMAPVKAHALLAIHPRGPSKDTTPYLPVTGAPGLRFQEPAPMPDRSTRPAASAPTPALASTESSVAQANADAARSATTPDPAETGKTASNPDPSSPKPANGTPIKSTPAILPDAARPTVRPEDFLPYFQIPGSAQNPSDVTLLVPAPKSAPVPGAIPASSATYQQTPR